MWVLGGRVPLQDHSAYLNSHGEFADEATNQLLCYNPSKQRWTSLQNFGTVPSPRAVHSTALLGYQVWLFGGTNGYGEAIQDNCFFKLDLKSCTWTQIQTNNIIPQPRSYCSLVAISNTELLLHNDTTLPWRSDTWIIDLPSSTWRIYTSEDTKRYRQTCSAGVNRCAIIIGGAWDEGEPEQQDASKFSFEVMLEPKSLKQLAMKKIYRERNELPWMCLPPKLIAQLDLML